GACARRRPPARRARCGRARRPIAVPPASSPAEHSAPGGPPAAPPGGTLPGVNPPHRTIVALAVLGGMAATARAQSFTSPRGLLGLEGDASHFALFDPGYERFMQIDDSQRGTPPVVLRGIAFRRDGDRANSSATARRLDL